MVPVMNAAEHPVMGGLGNAHGVPLSRSKTHSAKLGTNLSKGRRAPWRAINAPTYWDVHTKRPTFAKTINVNDTGDAEFAPLRRRWGMGQDNKQQAGIAAGVCNLSTTHN